MARDKPIIFSGPMVRALIDGRKTQDRRALKPQIIPCVTWGDPPPGTYPSNHGWSRFPYALGDRLWVREHCATWEGDHRDVVYRADETDQGWSDLSHDARTGAPWKRRPSIHMPRWASRLTLTVTDVRVQRVQEVSEEDAEAEGARPAFSYPGWGGVSSVPWYRWGFHELWDALNAKRGYGWERNPWVVALTFTVDQRNIDAAPSQEGGL